MEIRKLNFGDTFKIASIIKKTNIKNELSVIVNDVKKSGEKDTEKIGISIILSIVEAVPIAQNEICNFIGSMIGQSGTEVEEMPIEDVMLVIKNIIKENDFQNFFSSVLK